MIIIFYSPQFLPQMGGLQHVVHYWADACTKMGYHITVVTETAGKNDILYKYSIKRGLSLFDKWKLMRTADATIMFNVSLKGMLPLLLSFKPLIISHHTALYYPGRRRAIRQRLKEWIANHVALYNVACSKYIARQYQQCDVVHSPYNDLVFKNTKCNRRKPQSILFVGRFVSDKGIDLLIHSFSQIQMEFPESILNIVGAGPDERYLTTLIAQYEMQHSVTILGMQNEPALLEIYNEHEILVVPSRMEPFGIVVLEGLACGCNVLVSDQGGLPEAGGAFVSYFEAGNVRSLTSSLRKILTDPNHRYHEVGLCGHLQANSIESTATALCNNINKKLIGRR